MEAAPTTSPPLLGYESDGQPVHAVPSGVETEADEEFATPSAPEVGGYGLRTRTVRPSTRARARRNTLPSDRRSGPFPNSTRVQAALRRVRKLEYAGSNPASQSSLESQESLLWDSGAQALTDPLGQKRLWSSSTASTQFDVTVLKTETDSDEMDGAGSVVGERDRIGAGTSKGMDTAHNGLNHEASDADTVSRQSADTIVNNVRPTPTPRTSRTNTPAPPQLAIGNNVPCVTLQPERPLTPLLQLRLVPPPTPPPRTQDPDSSMNDWAKRVDRLFMDADDLVLLYNGANVPQSQIETIREAAQTTAAALRDCAPHCDQGQAGPDRRLPQEHCCCVGTACRGQLPGRGLFFLLVEV
jgi:hypothetical protein